MLTVEAIDEKLHALPAKPGAYLFKNAAGQVLYVGKAACLRTRVRSYFGGQRGFSPKTVSLVQAVQDIETLVTDSEIEALLLEINLIKRHRPRYNIMFRDDKQYLYIKITTGETYPRVFTTRKITRDGSRYFGPFTSAKALRQTLKLLNRLFPYRTCSLDMAKEWDRPCLKYHIELCNGPCIRVVTPEVYRGVIDQTIDFLEGRADYVVDKMRESMEIAAAELKFEAAALMRDRIRSIEKVIVEQKMVDPRRGDRDVVGIARDGREAMGQVLNVRNGKVVGQETYRLQVTGGETDEEITSEFVREYYHRAPEVPREILLPTGVNDGEILTAWLQTLREGSVRLRVPKRGVLRRLVKLAESNAGETLEADRTILLNSSRRLRHALLEAGQALDLPRLPRRIECYDISHIQGSLTVASMVVFEDGVPKKGKYRRFKIRGSANDDFAAMREVIRRRFKRLAEAGGRKDGGGLGVRALKRVPLTDFDPAAPLPETAEESVGTSKEWNSVPDLILIDGGKGQLSAALKAMYEVGVEGLPTAAIAKKREELFLPGNPSPILLPASSDGLHLLQRIRDEAHRFAVSFHIRLRTKAGRRSILDEIPGIGPKRKRALYRKFGSLTRIREAGVEELASVKGMSKPAAMALKESL
ncbi:MAG: excinuclease ABC subunit UvrC [Chloroflexi bacterium]|nr:excinuclease ABC subunit UvrC [Chloroflexota bacterium]MCY3937623.1 excinuclease ABC subunit UvrC [Chloroflexota bacterium]